MNKIYARKKLHIYFLFNFWKDVSSPVRQCCEFFHPGSRIQGQKDSGSASKSLSIFNPNNSFKALGNMTWYVHCSSRIRIWIFLPIPDPGVKKGNQSPDPDPQHCRLVCRKYPLYWGATFLNGWRRGKGWTARWTCSPRPGATRSDIWALKGLSHEMDLAFDYMYG